MTLLRNTKIYIYKLSGSNYALIKYHKYLVETLNKMLTIFGVSIVLFFLKLLNGNRNCPTSMFWYHMAISDI